MAYQGRAVAIADELGELVDRVLEARRRSDALFDLVRPGSLYERPIPERHRIIFYLGHLEAFDWNLLGRNFPDLKTSHLELDRLFAFGIDPVGGGLPADQPSDWPHSDAVRNYVSQVRRCARRGARSHQCRARPFDRRELSRCALCSTSRLSIA